MYLNTTCAHCYYVLLFLDPLKVCTYIHIYLPEIHIDISNSTSTLLCSFNSYSFPYLWFSSTGQNWHIYILTSSFLECIKRSFWIDILCYQSKKQEECLWIWSYYLFRVTFDFSQRTYYPDTSSQLLNCSYSLSFFFYL